MSLKLSLCSYCNKKKMMENADTYCISCRTDVMDRIRKLKYIKHLTNSNGEAIAERHGKNLEAIEKSILRKEGIDI